MVNAIPSGFHSVTPSFTFKDSAKAMDFYKKAFGAKVLSVFPGMDGKGVMHATVQIGDSILMMGDEGMGPECKSAQTLGGSPISLFIYVENVDVFFKQAVQAGATVSMPVADMFWGDRAGNLKDPFGYSWMIATQKKVLSKEEVRRNAEGFFAGVGRK